MGLTAAECREALARHESRKFAAALGRVEAVGARRHGPQAAWVLVALDAAGAVVDDFSWRKLKWGEG